MKVTLELAKFHFISEMHLVVMIATLFFIGFFSYKAYKAYKEKILAYDEDANSIKEDANSIKSTESNESEESTESTESTESKESEESTESTESKESEESTESKESEESTESNQSEESTEEEESSWVWNLVLAEIIGEDEEMGERILYARLKPGKQLGKLVPCKVCDHLRDTIIQPGDLVLLEVEETNRSFYKILKIVIPNDSFGIT